MDEIIKNEIFKNEILKAEHVSYTYQGKYQKVHALQDVSCTFSYGKFYAVTGRSGSGKTTLLSLLAGLDRPTQGEIYYEGKPYATLDTARLRREKLSIVFQNFQLFPLLTVEENIMYPMELSKVKAATAKERTGRLLEEVGLSGQLRKKYPAMLSGGEQQRVAIARALAAGAKLLLADEPTGNLDFENGENIIRILKNLVDQENYCVILVTHDRGIAEQADIVYHVQDGRIRPAASADGSAGCFCACEGNNCESRRLRKFMMKNSLKQLFRTPVKTGLFCIIFLCGTMLFTVGLNLWLEISEKIKAADETFVTIGMAEQKEQSTVMEQWWDAGLKDYMYQETRGYGEYLTPDILESLDIEYISPPRQRPYFGAVSPGNRTGGELTEESITGVSLAEIRPLEDCVPDRPVPAEVVRVLWGTRSLLGQKIYFCDHRTEQPDSLKAGTTYITYMGMNPVNADRHEGFEGIEYMPLRIYENQTRLWYEAGNGFYDTAEGAVWERIAEMLETCKEKMMPVTPVSDLQLLRPFHDGEAALAEGRRITPEEYEKGGRVCLIPQTFAQKNDLQVGDTLPLQFYFADYKYPLCQVAFVTGGMDMEAIDADGNILNPFWEGGYEIVGIYSYSVTLTNDPHAFAENQIFVPERSVSEDFKDHVTARGPMQAYNTSFRIKNGSIGRFMEEFSKLPESSLLEIEFDDGGYETFASKMKNTRIVAAALFFAGLALLLATIAFLMYFMILKQRRRTAVEQALGMTKRQCVISLLGGILVLTAVCSAAGAAAGMQMSQAVREAAESKDEGFSTAYTKGMPDSRGEEEASPDDAGGVKNEDGVENEAISENPSVDQRILVCLTALCETGVVSLLSLFFISRNLRAAPILVLSEKE